MTFAEWKAKYVRSTAPEAQGWHCHLHSGHGAIGGSEYTACVRAASAAGIELPRRDAASVTINEPVPARSIEVGELKYTEYPDAIFVPALLEAWHQVLEFERFKMCKNGGIGGGIYRHRPFDELATAAVAMARALVAAAAVPENVQGGGLSE